MEGIDGHCRSDGGGDNGWWWWWYDYGKSPRLNYLISIGGVRDSSKTSHYGKRRDGQLFLVLLGSLCLSIYACI